ncbi:hypothetical protein [Kitasatospora sp. NPDC005751]|uniref:hypothetical protein n=1 Tax=Kitasatospora sp. NPDC005751 TaxID=3157064 RepID=UPI0033E4D0F8
MITSNRPLMTSVAAGIGGTALALVDAPSWLTAAAFGCFALGLVVIAIQSVFPQESAHRLAWWRALWRHRQLRHQTSPACRPANPAHAGSTDPDKVLVPGDGAATREEDRPDC